MIEPKFSFLYGGTPFSEIEKTKTCNDNKTVYMTDDGLEVTLSAIKYPEYKATEWVIYFKYTGKGQSKTLSDIYDADISIDLPPYKRGFKGNRLKDGAPKIVKMTGCVPCSLRYFAPAAQIFLSRNSDASPS